MLKIAICDDDNIVCSKIEQTILDYGNTCNIDVDIQVFWTGEELIKHIKNSNCFDLIFLDIELNTTTGIEIGSIIRNVLDDHISKIVFISSTMGYERQLFDVQPLNFLEKPINKEKLIKSIDLVLKILNKEKTTFKYKVGHDFKQINLKDVLYFESKLRKIKIISLYGEDEFYSTLEKEKKQLPNNFVTAHSSFIINYNYIEKISGETIIMKNGILIPISKVNLKEIHNLQIQMIKEIRDVNL